MIKPDFFGHLTTGMFNLIVKDPRRTPPKAGRFGSGLTRLVAVRPRTCCAVLRRVCKYYACIAQAALGELSESIEVQPPCQHKLLIILWISWTHLYRSVRLILRPSLSFEAFVVSDNRQNSGLPGASAPGKLPEITTQH